MEGNNNGGRGSQKPKQRSASMGISFGRSMENLSRAGRRTFEIVNQDKRREPFDTRENSISAFFDRSCRCYQWLLPGWLVEERRMLSGDRRLYKYYYDPSGKLYNRKHKVTTIIRSLEKNRVMIILDN